MIKNSLSLGTRIKTRLKNFVGDKQKDFFSDKGIVVSIGDGIANVYGLSSVQAGFRFGIKGMALNLEKNILGEVGVRNLKSWFFRSLGLMTDLSVTQLLWIEKYSILFSFCKLVGIFFLICILHIFLIKKVSLNRILCEAKMISKTSWVIIKDSTSFYGTIKGWLRLIVAFQAFIVFLSHQSLLKTRGSLFILAIIASHLIGKVVWSAELNISSVCDLLFFFIIVYGQLGFIALLTKQKNKSFFLKLCSLWGVSSNQLSRLISRYYGNPLTFIKKGCSVVGTAVLGHLFTKYQINAEAAETAKYMSSIMESGEFEKAVSTVRHDVVVNYETSSVENERYIAANGSKISKAYSEYMRTKMSSESRLLSNVKGCASDFETYLNSQKPGHQLKDPASFASKWLGTESGSGPINEHLSITRLKDIETALEAPSIDLEP